MMEGKRAASLTENCPRKQRADEADAYLATLMPSRRNRLLLDHRGANQSRGAQNSEVTQRMDGVVAPRRSRRVARLLHPRARMGGF
jgi:hypothetical protein